MTSSSGWCTDASVVQSLVTDIEALLDGTQPLIQAGQGTMSFVPAVTD